MDFTQPNTYEDGIPITPTVEFTEDEWATFYEGSCIDKTHLSYLVRSSEYGEHWIPKQFVRLKN